MPVFERNSDRVLFIHVPKTGGTSIEKLFVDNGWRMSFFDGGGERSINPVLKCSPQHFHAEMISSLFDVSAFEAVFMLVREPSNRLVSEFNWRKKHGLIGSDSDCNNWIQEAVLGYEDNSFVLDNHVRPQCQFELPEARVFRLEDGLSDVVKWLSKTLDVEFSGGEVWEMKSSESGAATVNCLAESTLCLLREFYSDDYTRFY